MSIKLTLLKTGEQLISEMKELVPEGQEQVHAYLLDNPHTVEINEKQFLLENFINWTKIILGLKICTYLRFPPDP